MALDKWIAALFLVGALIYGYAAFTYPLLPFERNMPVLPSTLPKALAAAAGLLSLLILIAPRPTAGEGAGLGRVDFDEVRGWRFDRGLMLIAAMVFYALALRPLGFLFSTTAFLAGTGWILGERKLQFMLPIAMAGAGVVWFLVQEALGIFLRPLPWFLT